MSDLDRWCPYRPCRERAEGQAVAVGSGGPVPLCPQHRGLVLATLRQNGPVVRHLLVDSVLDDDGHVALFVRPRRRKE